MHPADHPNVESAVPGDALNDVAPQQGQSPGVMLSTANRDLADKQSDNTLTS